LVTGEGEQHSSESGERGVGDALRSAIQRTLEATTSSETRGRAAELLDEVARRGQEAGAELAKRGQLAADELGKQLEALEARLASIEEMLRRQGAGDDEPPASRADAERSEGDSQPEAER
jgi:hypothetical protein